MYHDLIFSYVVFFKQNHICAKHKISFAKFKKKAALPPFCFLLPRGTFFILSNSFGIYFCIFMQYSSFFIS